jgi:hypothetical protein
LDRGRRETGSGSGTRAWDAGLPARDSPNDEQRALTMVVEQQKRDDHRAILAIEMERLLETSFGKKSSNLDNIDHLAALVEMP